MAQFDIWNEPRAEIIFTQDTLVSYLHELGRKHWSGTLIASRYGKLKKIFFNQGFIIHSSSEFPGEKLGEFLVRQHIFEREVMDEMLKVNKQTKEFFSDLIVKWGFLSPSDMRQKLEMLTLETLYDMLFWEKGIIELVSDEVPEQVRTSLLLDGKKIIKAEDFATPKYEFIRLHLPPRHIVVLRNSKKKPAIVHGPDLSNRLWLLADGTKTIGDLMVLSGSPPFRTAEAIFSLIRDRWLLIFDREYERTSEDKKYQELNKLVEEYIEENKYPEAIELLEQALLFNGEIPHVQEQLEKIQNIYVSILQDRFYPFDQIPVPYEDWDVASIDDPDEGFIFSRIDGQSTVKDLIQASGLGKFKTLSIVQYLLDKNLIYFKFSIPKKILIVDDDEGIVKMFQRALGSDYETFTAPNGKVALELFLEEKPDLVILDIILPKIHGFEVCKRMKEAAPLSKILIITAYQTEYYEAKSKELNADSYMPKPFKIMNLKKEINKLLAIR